MADTGNGLIQEPGRGPQGRNGAGSAGAIVCDTRCAGLEIGGGIGGDDEPKCASVERAGDALPDFPPGPGDVAAWRTIPRELWPAITDAEAESFLRRLVDEPSDLVAVPRNDALRCCGNGVVPLAVAYAFAEVALRAGVARWEGEGLIMLTPDTSHDAALTRCAQEQTAAASDAQAGDFGARLGVQDWVKEEAMIRGGEDA